MRDLHFRKSLLAGAAALALNACGGGDSGPAVEPIPPAPTTPTPAPTPTPSVSAVQIFPSITATTDFAALGIQATRTLAPSVANAAVSVRYDASTGNYVMSFPGAPAAPFYQFNANSQNSSWWGGVTLEPNGNAPATVTVLKPTNPERQFSYTSLATYDTGGMGGGSFGWMAFGVPTPAGAVPTTGSATYTALVRGSTIDESFQVRGTATLAFDFAAGTLGGHFDPTHYDLLLFGGNGQNLGRYDFVNPVYSAGSPIFSGQLTKAGTTEMGAFDGQFTGPSAQELMARWTITNGGNPTMFGVWVGSK